MHNSTDTTWLIWLFPHKEEFLLNLDTSTWLLGAFSKSQLNDSSAAQSDILGAISDSQITQLHSGVHSALQSHHSWSPRTWTDVKLLLGQQLPLTHENSTTAAFILHFLCSLLPNTTGHSLHFHIPLPAHYAVLPPGLSTLEESVMQ